MKNKFLISFEYSIPFDPYYNSIKDEINMDQYTMKKTKGKINLFYAKLAGIIAILVLFVCIISYTFGSPKIKYIDPTNVLVFNHDKEFVDYYENIFIARVTQKIKTIQYDGTGMNIPYTFYKVEPYYFFKGSSEIEDKTMCFYGGNKSSKKIELFKNNDELIEMGQYYLFFVNKNSEYNSSRVDQNDYILSSNSQKILLNDFDNNKELVNQNISILNTINRYKNIIEKKLGNEILDIPDISNEQELYEKFTFAAVIQIKNNIPFSTQGYGIYSEVVASYYNVEVLVSFKTEPDETHKNLYCYGTNFWDKTLYTHFVDMLKENQVYLIFANECIDNTENTRINIGDLVVMDNYQLIELKNYQIGCSYEKQNVSVKEIVEKYIK